MPNITENKVRFISKKKCDAIIFSDFRHGIFNKNSIPDLTSSVNKGVFKAADSQVSARWGSINDFKKFDLITPNEREARFALADQDSSISVLTRKLVKQTKHKNLILKLGERGAIAQPNLSSKLLSFTIPSFVTKLIDSTGAGDALLPYATLAMIVSKSLLVSSIIGSLAAACECESDGNIAIKPEQLIKKINSIEDSLNYKSQKIH